MLCYLNRGLILEQVLCSLIHDYFQTLHLDNKYKNFHISVTTTHPFAELYLKDDLKAADSFPCVVITTQDDTKPSDFSELAPQDVEGIGLTLDDLKEITKTKETYLNKNGVQKEREIPGLCTVVDDNTLKAIKETIEKQNYCYGYSIRTRRQDNIGIEIWADNVQLKNEIYEQLRLFVTSNLRHILTEKYPFFDIAIFDNTIVGHRSNNFNFDFDIALSGAHIAMDIIYCVEQIVLDTSLTYSSSEIITEVINGRY